MSFITIPAVIEIEVQEQVNGNDKRRITEALRKLIKDEAIGDSLASSLYEQGETEVDGVTISSPENTLTARSAELPFEDILRRAVKPGEPVTMAHLQKIEDYWHECQRQMEAEQGR